MSHLTELAIAEDVLEGIIARAKHNRHSEIVGMLAGALGGVAVKDFELPNVLDGPADFLADPYAQFLAERAIALEGSTVLALYHSHPLGDATFSDIDARFAAGWDCPHLVVGLSPAVEYKAYAVHSSGRVVQVPVRSIAK
jgi:proteasome lid subunit RPN8/RPN11